MSDPDRAEPSGAQEPAAPDYVAGVLAGDRTWLARTVTLVESTRPEHRAVAGEVLERLAPHAADAHRVGVTGPPGAGKSTLIDALGAHLCERGHRVAVLAGCGETANGRHCMPFPVDRPVLREKLYVRGDSSLRG